MNFRMEEKISIIIPIYNTETYLPRCLDSLVNQTYKNLEIICINNNSTDGCDSILNGYAKVDNRIKVLNNKINSISIARNIGIKSATGKYIGFVDSDDYVDSEMIEKVYKKIKEHDSDICFWCYYRFDNKTTICDTKFNGVLLYEGTVDPFSIHTYKNHDVLSITNPAPWNKLFKTSFLINNNIFFPECYVGEDIYFTFLTIISASSITFLKERLYYYRVRDDSAIHNLTKDPLCFCDSLLMLKNKIIEFNYRDLLRETFKKMVYSVTNACFSVIKKNMDESDYLKLMKEYNKKYKDDLVL